MSRVTLKDTQRERRVFAARSAAALLLVLALFGILLSRYHTLQIDD